MNYNIDNATQWSENVIIADADFVDKVAFDLTVNFERMLGRRIPKADLARWIDCVALDGGLREGNNSVQVVLLHDRQKAALDNFVPSDLKEELNGKAFSDNLGEFAISAYPVESMVSKAEFMADIVLAACGKKEVRRLMIIPDEEESYGIIRQTLRHAGADDKTITLFAMQPMQGGNFRQEILGYSIMSALGIGADELNG